MLAGVLLSRHHSAFDSYGMPISKMLLETSPVHAKCENETLFVETKAHTKMLNNLG